MSKISRPSVRRTLRHYCVTPNYEICHVTKMPARNRTSTFHDKFPKIFASLTEALSQGLFSRCRQTKACQRGSLDSFQKHPVGGIAHECAVKEALSAQVYPTFLSGEHARIEKEISDKLNSLARDQNPLRSLPYRTTISHRYMYVHPRDAVLVMRSGKGPFQFLREIKPISVGSLFYRIPDFSHLFNAY